MARGDVETLEAIKQSCNGAFRYDGYDVVSRAASHGQLKVLRWAATRFRAPFTGTTIGYDAASAGQLTTLQWLARRGLVLDMITYASAAWNGDMHVLKYLRTRVVPWNGRATFLVKSRHGRSHEIMTADEIDALARSVPDDIG
ncbi:MAG: hypothetical protein KGL39_01325 [Patescibacteria group bacterium]|nr:hypothetical protein [Patescibacteria group bacterium]